VADLEVDTRAKRVKRAGNQIQLTTKEYALIDTWPDTADRVVGRPKLPGMCGTKSLISSLISLRCMSSVCAASSTMVMN